MKLEEVIYKTVSCIIPFEDKAEISARRIDLVAALRSFAEAVRSKLCYHENHRHRLPCPDCGEKPLKECPNLTLQCSCGKKVPHGEPVADLPEEVKGKVDFIKSWIAEVVRVGKVHGAPYWSTNMDSEIDELVKVCLKRRGA